MRNAGSLVVLVGVALLAAACSSGVDEERVEAKGQIDELAALEGRVQAVADRLEEVEESRVELETQIAHLEDQLAGLLDLVGELTQPREFVGAIQPYPQSFVEDFVEGCVGGDEADRPACECMVDELQRTLPLEDFLLLSASALQGDIASARGTCVALLG